MLGWVAEINFDFYLLSLFWLIPGESTFHSFVYFSNSLPSCSIHWYSLSISQEFVLLRLVFIIPNRISNLPYVSVFSSGTAYCTFNVNVVVLVHGFVIWVIRATATACRKIIPRVCFGWYRDFRSKQYFKQRMLNRMRWNSMLKVKLFDAKNLVKNTWNSVLKPRARAGKCRNLRHHETRPSLLFQRFFTKNAFFNRRFKVLVNKI